MYYYYPIIIYRCKVLANSVNNMAASRSAFLGRSTHFKPWSQTTKGSSKKSPDLVDGHQHPGQPLKDINTSLIPSVYEYLYPAIYYLSFFSEAL